MDPSQPVHPIDYPHSSGLSEADSLSDSDWLDISSSKESDDNDSVSSKASDRDEVDYGPRSRRSSTSLGSSRDGDIEAWEGFAEDSADELAPHDDLTGLSIPPTLPPALHSTAGGPDDALAISSDLVADQCIKATLDQSTTGTLSASRTSSLAGHASTAQNSIRDLKLSFPDPLTSSRDELNTTYDDTAPSETTSEGDIAPPSTTHAVDPGPSPTPEVLNIVISNGRSHVVISDLEIVLYGIPAVARWLVVDDILEKAALGAGLTLTPFPKSSQRDSRLLHINGNHGTNNSFPNVVTVIDRTSDKFSFYPVGLTILSSNATTMTWRPEKHGRFQGTRPSLAIIFLPSMSSVSITHTCYLPIFVPSDNIENNEKRRRDAEGWSESSIETNALFAVKPDAGSVVDISDIANLSALHVHNALGHLLTRADSAKRRHAETTKQAQMAGDRPISIFFRAAVTGYDVFGSFLLVFRGINSNLTRSLLAIMAILIVRLCVPDAKHLPTPALQTSTITRDRILSVVNKSSPITPSHAAVIPSCLKDFALSVFNPAPLCPSASSAASTAKQSSSTGNPSTDTKAKEPGCGDGKLMTWSEKVKSSKDLILPGSPSFSFEAKSKKALSLIVPKNTIVPTGATPSALSVRLVDSLSQTFNVKALSEVVRHDMKELSDAIDQLMIAIGKQTTAIMKESQGISKLLRERLEQRHGKAKARARRMKDMGGQLGGQILSYVGHGIKSRGDGAKGKARGIVETLVLSDAWTIHRNRAKEHRKRMEESSVERRKRREIRRARRQAKGKNNSKKTWRGIFSTA